MTKEKEEGVCLDLAKLNLTLTQTPLGKEVSWTERVFCASQNGKQETHGRCADSRQT